MKRPQIAAIGIVAILSIGLFSWGSIAGADEVMGVIANAKDAQIIVSDQPDAGGTITIDKVVAPHDGYVVIHQNQSGMPGERVGFVWVAKGTSRDIEVRLDPKVPLTPELLAAVHIDRGKKRTLEFDMENAEHSPDQPLFVNGKELSRSFKAAEYGVSVPMDQASITAADQRVDGAVTISQVVAPADAFVVVHKAKADGMPGERVGFAFVKAGESEGVKVDLAKKLDSRTKLIAAVHVDRGAPGELEFDMDRPVDSPDQPFFTDGMEVATAFEVGPFGVEAESASIEATDQVGAAGAITVAKVDAPSDAWIVVHKDAAGAPGERVGLARVKAGVSRDVRVALSTDMLSENLFVALHADRGTAEQFDFDMDHKLNSADQPYFVDGSEVATAIKVRSFGYPTPARTADISVPAQVVKDALLRVNRAVAPEPAWIVVHLDAGGMPGARVGLAAIQAGLTRNAAVQLDASMNLTEKLFVAVHADRGQQRSFDFNMMDKVNSPDQPYFVNGVEVATAVSVR